MILLLIGVLCAPIVVTIGALVVLHDLNNRKGGRMETFLPRPKMQLTYVDFGNLRDYYYKWDASVNRLPVARIWKIAVKNERWWNWL